MVNNVYINKYYIMYTWISYVYILSYSWFGFYFVATILVFFDFLARFIFWVGLNSLYNQIIIMKLPKTDSKYSFSI